MKVLWALSSVGKGHIMRDFAIVNQLKRIIDVDIDWLAPYPANTFIRSYGFNVLECSSLLEGSGKIYEQVFSNCSDEFNLIDYISADTKLHRQDFSVSLTAWKKNKYDLIIADEAFWLLSGFGSGWSEKPCPFIFLTDFVGTKPMHFRIRDIFISWINNLKFSFSFHVPDIFIYIGNEREIPDDSLGFLLPNRRNWAQNHCNFVKPIVNFDPKSIESKNQIRKKLNLPEGRKIFLATVGPEGNFIQRISVIEEVFENLKQDFPDAFFIINGSESGTKCWIHYHKYLDGLFNYFAASDFVITQSGYGKIVELCALGIPFIAIPLDFHFEQEYIMRHRLDYYGVGKIVTMRDNNPKSITKIVRQIMNVNIPGIEVDKGYEVSKIILDFMKIGQCY